MRKARVFISCGQNKDYEKETGQKIYNYFVDRGFEAYFAERVHSPEALTENIFEALKKSEYFLFIDFKRDKIRKKLSRGSLFVNQEVGIASFLKLPILGFCENGIKREGIMDCQIINPISFTDRSEILSKLSDLTKDWDNNSVNELTLSHNAKDDSKNIEFYKEPERGLADWFHIEVFNRHKTKHAKSCQAYLVEIEDRDRCAPIWAPTREFIWSGLGDYSINILANKKREFDAFFVTHLDNKIIFHCRKITTSNPRYQMPELNKGIYRLRYVVASDNFEYTEKDFELDYRNSIQSIKFEPI